MDASKCNLKQACEWIAFGWKPMTPEEEFESGRIRPQQPYADIDASKEVRSSWDKYRKNIQDAADKIKSALRAGTLQVKGRADLHELIAHIESRFQNGTISEADRNAQIKECEYLQDNITLLPSLPPSLSENPDIIIAETQEGMAELQEKAKKCELDCKYVYSAKRAKALESKVDPLGPHQIEFYTNRQIANSDELEPIKHMVFTELEFSFPALQKLFPFKKPTLKEQLSCTGYTTPYLDIMLEIIEEEKITNDNQPKAETIVNIFKNKLTQKQLDPSNKLASSAVTLIRLPKSQKGGLKRVNITPKEA